MSIYRRQSEPDRHLSILRLLLAVVAISAVAVTSFYGHRQWQLDRSATAQIPWFAAYVDVTATPRFAFEQMGSSSTRDGVLSFIVSLPANPCTPAWGGAYTLDDASGALDLDRRIARLQQQGGSVAVSFGGLKNNELALGCTDSVKLETAYQSVINRYKIDTIDLDLEGDSLTNTDAGSRRATAIARLQAQQRAHGKHLAVWVTLPVTSQGLSEAGTTAVSQLLGKGVDLAGVNVMTMDYGNSLLPGQSMLSASESAVIQTQRQLGILYQQAHLPLRGADLWAKLGATPMIGQNDDAKQVFTLDDAQKFNVFSRSHGLSRLSMWSANRDIVCGSNYVNTAVASDSCSGVTQAKQAFANLLSRGFSGDLSLSSGLVTTASKPATVTQTADDPAASPYQIWSASGTYLSGTKVVWHHSVYQAKWWNQGATPDDPVLQTWQTPWQLIGPVLPGEKPIPQATLPAGTYPDWSGTETYDTGTRILFNGVPYQAKWWNQGSSPATASANPDGSPWVPLTQDQINQVISQGAAAS